jgi:ribosome-binding protein aMBF1 (putative translation factor)
MQKNVAAAQKGPNKKQQDFDSAFDKFSKLLTKDYKDQFKKPEYTVTAKQSKQVNNAMRQGKQVDFVKKGTGNKKPLNVNVAEALDDTKHIEIKTVPKETAIAIQNARNEKKLNQEKLGMLVSVGPHVIRDIENGTAHLNYDLINKIEKALDTKLPRPWKQEK